MINLEYHLLHKKSEQRPLCDFKRWNQQSVQLKKNYRRYRNSSQKHPGALMWILCTYMNIMNIIFINHMYIYIYVYITIFIPAPTYTNFNWDWTFLLDDSLRSRGSYVSLLTLGMFFSGCLWGCNEKNTPTATCQRCLRRICSLKFSALAWNSAKWWWRTLQTCGNCLAIVISCLFFLSNR